MGLIGTYLDEKMKKLIFRSSSYDFIDLERDKNKKPDLVVIDSEVADFEKKIRFLEKEKIPSLLLVSEMESIEGGDLQGKNCRCICRECISKIRDYIDEEMKKRKIDTIFLKDSNQVGMLKIAVIESITYSSINRECEFHLCDNTIFTVKKRFIEIEKIQLNSNFFKIERGTIVNLSHIQSLNYKNRCVIFKSGNFLYMNRRKLKELEEIMFSNCYGIYL